MSRYLQTAHDVPVFPIAAAVMPADGSRAPSPDATARTTSFVVKLRDASTKIWGNEVEVLAASARDAAELVAREPLRGGHGERVHLRARVWKLPHGSVPELHFFKETPAASDR